jgi:hypothetical protein
MMLQDNLFGQLPNPNAGFGLNNGNPMAGPSGFAGNMPGFGQPMPQQNSFMPQQQQPHGMFGAGFNRNLHIGGLGGAGGIPLHLGGPLGALLAAIF